MTDNPIVEQIAQVLYDNEGGMTAEDFVKVAGKQRRLWKTELPWDSQPEIELCEWERDEYRWQAAKVLEFIEARKKVA